MDKYDVELEERITKKLIELGGLSEELAKKNARLCINTYESVLHDLERENTDSIRGPGNYKTSPAISHMISIDHAHKKKNFKLNT